MKTFQTVLALCLLFAGNGVTAFVPSAVRGFGPIRQAPALNMDASAFSETANEIVSAVASSGLVVAETEPWVQPLSFVMGPTLNFLSFAMLCRVVASWYPNTKLNEFPWVVIAWPTEPLLRVVKGQIPPAFGVDITPVFWLAIFTFISEILLGQQGLLTMKMKYGM